MFIVRLIVLLSVFFASVSYAGLLVYSFEGTITGFADTDVTDVDVLQPMDTLSGSITVDSSAVPIFSGDDQIIWNSAVVAVSITVAGYTIVQDTSPAGVNSTRVANFPHVHLFETLQPTISGSIDGWSARTFVISAQHTQANLLIGLVLPTSFEGANSIPALLQLTNLDSDVVTAYVDVESIAVTEVPLPAAGWLFFCAAGFLGLQRFRLRT